MIIDKKVVFLWWNENKWQLQNFKECHGIRRLDRSSEVLSADVEAAEWYIELVHNLMEKCKLLLTQIYSTYETGLFWQCRMV
jgi:hypothetical protein